MNNEEQLIIKHEGLRLLPYLDSVGKLTIGVGRNIDDNGISQGEAMLLLRNDITRTKEELLSLGLKLNGARGAALVDMLFNLGLHNFLQFKNMIMALEMKDYIVAAEEMLDSKWASQVGNRANELAEMVKTNEWPESC